MKKQGSLLVRFRTATMHGASSVSIFRFYLTFINGVFQSLALFQ